MVSHEYGYPEHPAVTLMKKRAIERFAAEMARAIAPIQAGRMLEGICDTPLVGRDTSLDVLIEEMRKKQSGG